MWKWSPAAFDDHLSSTCSAKMLVILLLSLYGGKVEDKCTFFQAKRTYKVILKKGSTEPVLGLALILS